MINSVQKQLLIEKVQKFLEDFEQTEPCQPVQLIEENKIYKIETNGSVILFRDYIDPDVFIFYDIEQFENFIKNKY